MPQQGTWAVNLGEYEATPTGPGGDAISVLSFAETLPDDYVVEATFESFDGGPGFYTNGVFIFDYVNANEFKWVGIFVGADKYKIGHFDGTSWINAGLPHEAVLETNTDYDLRLEVRGSVVTLTEGGEVRIVHDFAEPLNDG